MIGQNCCLTWIIRELMPSLKSYKEVSASFMQEWNKGVPQHFLAGEIIREKKEKREREREER